MRLNGFQRLALVTTLATYFLIAIGGLVRAAGAGLGCPDWPKCFDRWIPPTSVADVPPHIDPALFNFAKAWTEYLNRLAGVLVGILIFLTLLLAIRQYRKTPRVLWPTVAAFLLVGFEGWLGGMVVRSQLAPLVLTAHLVLALVIVSLLLYATVCAFFPSGRPLAVVSPERRRLARVTFGGLLLVLVQVALGALLRGEVQLVGASGAGREVWLESVGIIKAIHQQSAVITTAAVLAIAWLVSFRVERDRWIRAAAAASAGLVLVQAAAGLGIARFGFPPALQVVHLWAASLLIGTLSVVALLAYRIDPRGTSLPSEPSADAGREREDEPQGNPAARIEPV